MKFTYFRIAHSAGRDNMPRTAPTVDGAPAEKAVVFSFIDHSGDERSVRNIIPSDATPAQIEAVVAQMAANSNANVYRVKVEDVYAGAKDASIAVNQTNPSVFSNIVVLMKVSSLISQQAYLPAPEGVLIPSGDVVDTANTDYIAWRDAYLTMLGTGYVAQSVRFTERREKNDSIPA